MAEECKILPAVKAEPDRAYERIFGGVWCLARCTRCGKVISRYDFTLEESQHFGEDAIRTGEHSCAQ